MHFAIQNAVDLIGVIQFRKRGLRYCTLATGVFQRAHRNVTASHMLVHQIASSCHKRPRNPGTQFTWIGHRRTVGTAQ
jgi:hypothetical protein